MRSAQADAAAAAGAAAPPPRHACSTSWNEGPDVPGDRPASDLHCHDGRRAFQESHHQYSKDIVVGMFVFRRLGEVGGDGSHEAVAKQNAEERADQRRGDFVADFLGRAIDRAHRDDDAEHGGDDAEAGQRVGHGAQGRYRLGCIVMLYFHIELEQLIHIEWLDAARNGHAHGVANEVASMVIFDKGRILREHGTFVGLSISDSSATRPSLRALLSNSYIIFSESR